MDVETLTATAAEADRTVSEARTRLIHAIRDAHAQGMTQAEIAQATGRSQPEISRLLRFHGTTPLARTLRRHRTEITRLVREAGGSHVRVFGSVATGSEHSNSDVDLLFTMHRPLSLMELAALEEELGTIVGTTVDLVPDQSLRPDLAAKVAAEALDL